MRRSVGARLFAVAAIAGALLVVPDVGPASAATGTSCSGDVYATPTTSSLSGCTDVPNTGGGGAMVFLISGVSLTGTVMWNGTGTTTFKFAYKASSSNVCGAGSAEIDLRGTVTGGTGAALTSLPAGSSVSESLCSTTHGSPSVSLAPGSEFVIGSLGAQPVRCTRSEVCDATASELASVTSPGLRVEVTGRSSIGTGTIDLTIGPGTLQCPNAPTATLVTTETNTGFAAKDPLLVTLTYSLAAATSQEETCFKSTVPFVSQSNPTVPKAGTFLLLSCSSVTAKTGSACELSSKQVGTNIVVQDRFYAGDPKFAIVVPTGKGQQTWLSRFSKGTVGKPFDAQFQSSGGKSPVSWNVASGNLPGCTLNAKTGTITGKPTSTGSYTIVVQATDSERPPRTAKMSVPITVT